jgi:hypothetical protein
VSWRDAPLYVRSHDLTRWILERVDTWEGRTAQRLGGAISSAAQGVLCSVSLALTFPEEREEHLSASDRDIVRLRVLLRLAKDLGLLSPGRHRYVSGELLEIGRMLGGWRKRWGRRRDRQQKRQERATLNEERSPHEHPS